jgi:sugar phosphate isomerase/epimerase
MKISFTTLGCPDWDLDTIISKGSACGYDGVDFRGIQDIIDITQLPAFTSDIAATRQRFKAAGLEVSGISSSIKVCVPDQRAANVEEAKRSIGVARELGCGQIRVFGGGDLGASSRQGLADIGRGCLEEILALDGARDFKWVFETHDLWIKAQDCALLLERIPDPAFGVLWDMGHTARVGGESPEETYAAVGDRVFYTHVKDAVYDQDHAEAMKDGWRYVDPGTGQLPLAKAIEVLKENGYDGWIMFEHEKRWHRELPEPEVIFPKFVDWIRPLL